MEIVSAGAIDEEQDKVMVQSLLDFKDSMEAACASSFAGAPALSLALRSALETAINTRQDRPSELVAKYVDGKMRSASGGAGWERELERTMDRVMSLFRCIHGKDVFEAFYKKDLARRLLLGKSSSTEMEKAMVARIKGECGAAFTSKLECMFKDVELSKDINAKFRESVEAAGGAVGGGGAGSSSSGGGGGGSSSGGALGLSSKGGTISSEGSSGGGGMEEEGGASGGGGSGGGGGSPLLRAGEGALDVYVHLLTASHWPTYPPSTGVQLAPDMAAAGAAFERFYTSKYSSRRLTWVTQVGTCILRAAFPSGRKELDVSLHQALVLLQYNGSGAWEYGALARATGIEAAELKRTLQSLSLGVVRVLRKEPKGKDVSEGDVFTFNAAFAHALTRIKINQIQIKETKAEADATHEKVFQERQYQVDAAVVRIMKARKVLSHTLLMGSIMEQLRFDCAAADIKTRIESLIDREYLERDPQNPSNYHYVA